MKKLCILLMVLIPAWTSQAQSRKYISQFSHLQNYYNPGLTGYEGSSIRGLVRNQWVGFEGAPKTYFISTELNFADLSKGGNPGESDKNAMGISLLHDQFGAFLETELIGSYATRIRLNKSTSLRLGAGVNYNFVRLDGNRLSTEQAKDPQVMQYANGFANMQILDFNIGMALTHAKFYLSYAVQNVNEGAISSGEIFMDRKPRVSVFQGGFRDALTPNLAIATNFMYRSQQDLPDNIEFNIKALFMDNIWLGAGHRISYANNFQLGIILPMMRIGYIYELPMNKSYLLPNTTHEFLAVFPIFRKNDSGESKQVLIW